MNDQATRDYLISPIGLKSNIFLEANAGSGKTTMLVNRIVAMIESGIDIKNIAAVTFTKKAANEFYEKILKELKDKERKAKNWSEKDLFRKAIGDIDSCFFGTIDAFCLKIVSEHPIDANLPTNVGVQDDDILDKYYKEEYSRIGSGEYGPDLAEMLKKCEDFLNVSSKNFPALLRLALNKRNVPIHVDAALAGKEFKDAFNTSDFHDFASLCKELSKYHKEIRHSAGKSKIAWGSLDEFVRDYEQNGIDAFARNKLNFIGLGLEDITPFPYIDVYFEVVDKPKGKKPFSEIAKMKSETMILEKIADYKRNLMAAFLSECVKKVPPHLKEVGALGFFDILLYTRDLLKKDIEENGGGLCKYIRKKYRYFLLDEFQDTDPLEAEIFFYLSTDDPKSNYEDCDAEPGALFVVGDPKQSIYLFRGADINSFIHIRELFAKKGYCVLNLTKNFRSCAELKKWFNRSFAGDFFKSTKITHKSIEDENSGSFTNGGVYSYKSSQLCDVLSFLRKMKYSNDDIMIITPNTTAHKDLKKILSGTPMNIEGKNDLKENDALKRIGAILRAAIDTKPYYVVNALEADGFTDKKLAYLHNEKGYRFSATYDPKYACPELEDFLTKLKKIRKLDYQSMIDAIIRDFDIFAHYSMDNLQEVYSFKEKLSNLLLTGFLATPKEICSFLEDYLSVIGEGKFERFSPLKEKDDSIHIANVHKVKGLSSKVVILYGKKPKDRKPEESIYEGERYFWSLSNGYAPLFDFTSCHQNIWTKREIEEDEEKQRLLYVAATRAKEILFICETDYWADLKKEDISGREKIPTFEDLISTAVISSEPEKEPKSIDPMDVGSEGEPGEPLNRALLETTYQTILPSKEDHHLPTKHAREEDSKEPPVSDIDARTKGTIIHRLMEKMVSYLPSVAEKKLLVSSILDEYDLPKGGSYEKMLLKVYERMANGGYSQETAEVPSDLMNALKGAKEVYCEVPFAYQEGDKVISGYMDLVYADKEGNYHIIDYKTNLDGVDLEKCYSAQLGEYAKALKETSGVDATAHIYHIDVK